MLRLAQRYAKRMYSQSGLTAAEFAEFVETVTPMLACYSGGGTLRYCNSAYALLFGKVQADIVGKHYSEFIGEEGTQAIDAVIGHVVAGQTTRVTRRRRRNDGTSGVVEVTLTPGGSIEQRNLYVAMYDVTEHDAAINEVRDGASRIDRFFQATQEGLAFHSDGIITDVNPALLRLLGYSHDELMGRPMVELVEATERRRIERAISFEGAVSYESFALHKSGRSMPVEYSTINFDWTEGNQRLMVVRDISARREIEARIRFMATHDALTGLPNRAQLNERLEALVFANAQTKTPLTVLFVDLDQLKRVNDSLGHAAGDALLCGVADRLVNLCATQGAQFGQAWAARMGGDEFVMVLSGCEREHWDAFIRAVHATLEAPMDVHGRSIRLTASIGVAMHPEHGGSAAELIKNADAAMYQAKKDGRHSVRIFDHTIADAAARAIAIESELDEALRRNDFVLFYQPQISINGIDLLGAEALIRWQHPTRGLLQPDEFIPIAEALRIILPISLWVLDSALTQVVQWRALGWSGARVAVNLSSAQLRSLDFVDTILAALLKHGLPGSCLELEVTERMLMLDEQTLPQQLSRLSKAGVELAIDDFGTGYSSLSRLRSLPVKTLKIDRAFVAELPDAPSAVAIVKSVLELTRGLGLTAIAEGVEHPEQAACLASLGCKVMQGYLSGRPMPAAAFSDFLLASRPTANPTP
jgi:diguanylate cyclase (GGDEF)-like protein/PAS domain S-box-containing protein